MEDRKRLHKNSSKTSDFKKYIICRENGGYDNFVFEILEEYECNNDAERYMREQHWIDTLNPSMNSIRAYATEEQKIEYFKKYNLEHKEERKQWYLENKEERKEKRKEYYQENKEEVKEQSKIYRLKNKEKIKQWREKNSEIIECGCGSKYKKIYNSHHIKSKRHMKYINSIRV
tara:strand:+ start:256 stop:777 length:522 start_codon:yes stop_codon:yes gene_type:complete